MKIIKELGEFVAETKFENIPTHSVELAKLRTLDLIGAGIAGYKLGLYRPLFEILGGKKEATVWGVGAKYPIRDAVLINSFMAHSTYMEDGSRYTGGHPSSTVIPAVLSLGERRKSNGKDIILSIIVGYEVFLRLGKAIYPSTTIRGFQSTAVLGALGAAGGCASLLKLDKEKSKNALAISCNLGVGLKEALKNPDSQPIQVGRSSEGGLLAALFAEKGASGTDTIIEDGFLKAFADQTVDGNILSGLGKDYLIDETYIKIHGGCRGNHAPIDVILSLVKQNKILLEEIAKINIKIDSVTMIAEIHQPRNGREAQFSIPFSIAVALLYGDASIFQYTDERVNDPYVRELMSKIYVEIDDKLDKEYPRKRGAIGEIILKDGKSYINSIDFARGEPELPLQLEEIKDKFVLLTKDTLKQNTEKIYKDIINLEKVKNINIIINKLRETKGN